MSFRPKKKSSVVKMGIPRSFLASKWQQCTVCHSERKWGIPCYKMRGFSFVPHFGMTRLIGICNPELISCILMLLDCKSERARFKSLLIWIIQILTGLNKLVSEFLYIQQLTDAETSSAWRGNIYAFENCLIKKFLSFMYI